MRRHRLLAVALTGLVPMLLSPALAEAKPPSWAHDHGRSDQKPSRPDKPASHDNGRPDKPADKPKPPKAPKSGRLHVSGGGQTHSSAAFSVNAKQDKLSKGHFNYESADGLLKIKCRGFDSFTPVVTTPPGPPTVRMTANCEIRRETVGQPPVRSAGRLDATFVDNGEPGTNDRADITVTNPDGSTAVSDTGTLASGNVKIK